jgi:sodium transport system permease protein
VKTSPRRSGQWRIVFLKEFREIFRDRRTVFSVVVSPLLITPLLLGLLGTVIKGQVEGRRTEVLKVGIVGGGTIRKTLDGASAALGFEFVEADAKDLEARIKDRRLRAGVVLPAESGNLTAMTRTLPITILFDQGNDKSRAAADRLKALFAKSSEQIVGARLRANSLPAELAVPFKIEEKPIAAGGSMATMMLAMLLPYTLAVAAFGGGIYAANDLVAGEKERGTLETLLISPATRRDIVLGKFLAVAGVCLVSSLLSIVGLMIPFFSGLKAFDWLAKGGVNLSPTAITVTLIMQLPLAVLFAGVLLAISTFARNQKEAQTYLGPLFIIVLLPSMLSMLIGTEVGRGIALVPILNASLIIKQALSGAFDPVFITIAFVASVVYAGFALNAAIRLFQKESVLLKA